MPTLFIDADACPVTREAIDCARKARIPCVVVADSGHNLLKHVRANDPTEPRGGFWVRTISVQQGQDSADFAIVCELEPDDVVVTQDLGLAAMVLGRGARAIGVRGEVYDKYTIDALLLVRHAEKEARRNPRRHSTPKGGPRQFSNANRRHFVTQLEGLLKDGASTH